MLDNQTAGEHTVVWFYLCDDLAQAKRRAEDARASARVYWGSGRAQRDVFEADMRVAEIEKEISNVG